MWREGDETCAATEVCPTIPTFDDSNVKLDLPARRRGGCLQKKALTLTVSEDHQEGRCAAQPCRHTGLATWCTSLSLRNEDMREARKNRSRDMFHGEVTVSFARALSSWWTRPLLLTPNHLAPKFGQTAADAYSNYASKSAY